MGHDHAGDGRSVAHGHEGAFDSVPMAATLDAEGELVSVGDAGAARWAR